jgi:hypothetical protein
MALFSECMVQCARKGLDTADIVREGIFSQQSSLQEYVGCQTEAAINWQEFALSDARNGCLKGPLMGPIFGL